MRRRRSLCCGGANGSNGGRDMHYDAVFLGSIVTVVIAVVIVVFLAYKVSQLMKRDAESHKQGQK